MFPTRNQWILDNLRVLNLEMPIFMCICMFPQARWVLALQGYTELHAGGQRTKGDRGHVLSFLSGLSMVHSIHVHSPSHWTMTMMMTMMMMMMIMMMMMMTMMTMMMILDILIGTPNNFLRGFSGLDKQAMETPTAHINTFFPPRWRSDECC